ncbi:hypothetical protein [Spiroplasma floricola]|uniref:Uncharacterized protein n=1 Tax=Spiroplasma floricola 23-6 TaxID=1336749 RepID=A0A2K8SDN2_9MOLU|nr:hypothetical protein [Spiroplasma floricola]AUB31338.1 hypothetical protein SFLOR_v1c02810 [Spiroplasma floricola 23-6]
MEKLTIEQSKKVVGGKAVSGAFLSGIGSIMKGASELFTNFIGAISTTVFGALTINRNDKVELKIGNSTFKVDNTVSNKANAENKVSQMPNVVSLF